MKRPTLHGIYAVLFVTWVAFASSTLPARGQSPTDAPMIGTVRLTQTLLADGRPLPAGTYDVRLTNDRPLAAVGQSPGAERWVEFIKDGKVAGREVATVIPAAEIGAIAKGPAPAPNGSHVDVLKGGEYVRVWIARAGNNYIINLPFVRSS